MRSRRSISGQRMVVADLPRNLALCQSPTRGEDRFDERSFALDVRLAIARISRHQIVFQRPIGSGSVRMRAKIVSKRALILPESTADHCEMYVVLPWLPTPEEVTTTDALLAAKEVTSGLERRDGAPTLLVGVTLG